MSKEISKKEKRPKIPEYIITLAKSIEKEGSDLDMKAVTLTASGKIDWALSTGSLALDLITGGGYGVGRAISNFGLEASGKTTGALETIAESLKQGIPTVFYDAENALDTDYLDRIVFKKTGHGIDYYMGIIDGDGNVVKAGLFYFVPVNTCENVFRHASRLLKEMPDIVKSRDGKWFYSYKQKQGKNSLVEREQGGKASIVFIIDSLKALVSEAKDEKDTSSPLASLARSLSDSFPMVISKLKQKRGVLLYTNQLRTKIGVMFGSPEYEPCGDAAKFYSSLRARYGSISLSTVDKDFFKTSGNDNSEGKGQVDSEPSWNMEGTDRYRYAKVKTTKNKQFSPFQETYVRFRFEKAGAQGDGIDPSFDVYGYLLKTGQCSKKSGKGLSLSLRSFTNGEKFPSKIAALLKVKPSGKVKETFDFKCTWQKFKELVENPVHKNVLTRLAKHQMKTGFAWSLYFAVKNADSKREEPSEEK